MTDRRTPNFGLSTSFNEMMADAVLEASLEKGVAYVGAMISTDHITNEYVDQEYMTFQIPEGEEPVSFARDVVKQENAVRPSSSYTVLTAIYDMEMNPLRFKR